MRNKRLTCSRGSRKSLLDYVIPQFQLVSGTAEYVARAGSSLRHGLARSPDPNGTPSQSKGGRCSKRLVRMVQVPRGTGLQLMQSTNPVSIKKMKTKNVTTLHLRTILLILSIPVLALTARADSIVF